MSSSPSKRNPRVKPSKGTVTQVLFPTMPTLNRPAWEIQLTQKQGHHDLLKMTFKQTGKQWFEEIPTGLPVEFVWTQAGVRSSWFGYVSYVSKVVTSLREKTMEVMCVGTSFPLKERGVRVFTDVSIPDVVATIADEFNLEFVGDRSSRKFPQITIAGHSYWQWIQEQASRLGYAAYVDGVTLYFRSLDSIISKNSTSIPVLSIEDQSTLKGYRFEDRTLNYFKVLRGDYVESDKAQRTEKLTGGVDPVTMVPFVSSSSPQTIGKSLRESAGDVLFQEYRTDQVAMSVRDADIASEDYAQSSRFTLPAKARCLGDYRLRPFATVNVLGTGPSTDGFWIIEEAVHTFGQLGTYDVELVILSDGTGTPKFQGVSYGDTFGKDVVNIQEALDSGTAMTSSRPASTPKINNNFEAITNKQMAFTQSPSMWRAG